jgi:DNA (cytosine-5)-methyltransferase 1
MLVLSLFPGADLLGIAFEREGFTVVSGPDVIFGRDVRAFHPPPGRFDGLIGGPPCQMFSLLAHLVRASGYEPKFGNLIPEFERCVREARPEWFVMENVRAAPLPIVEGYGTRSFFLNNCWLPGDDPLVGQKQYRLRRFTFGLRGREAPNLMRWIDLAVFQLPVKHEAVTGGHGKPPSKRIGNSRKQYEARKRHGCVTSSTNGRFVRPARFSLAAACELQGLPRDFLAEAPFLADAKLKLVANGVPLPMGRAIARAVKSALASCRGEPGGEVEPGIA